VGVRSCSISDLPSRNVDSFAVCEVADSKSDTFPAPLALTPLPLPRLLTCCDLANQTLVHWSILGRSVDLLDLGSRAGNIIFGHSSSLRLITPSRPTAFAMLVPHRMREKGIALGRTPGLRR
jgi:hypothetical protein